MILGCREICHAACCTGIRKIQLSASEASKMRNRGWVLWETYDSGVYKPENVCPMLNGNCCIIHDSSDQPEICRDFGFRFMSRGCRGFRQARPDLVKSWLPGEVETWNRLIISAEFKFFLAWIFRCWLGRKISNTLHLDSIGVE